MGDRWRQHEYFDEAEQYMEHNWTSLVWPWIKDCDLSVVVDLAAGRGRNTAKLIPVSESVWVVDINPENVQACKERFGAENGLRYLVCDGTSIRGIPGDSVSLVYCFDAMVHFDSDAVRSYLRDFRRVLRPGGHAFCHHSNYSANPGGDVFANPQWRNFMSAELFKHYALKEKLRVVRSEVRDWGDDVALDCVTLLERPCAT